MIGRLRDLTRGFDGDQIISVAVKTDFREEFDRLKDCDISIEIKKASKARSKTANDFCWAMCTDIGKSMRPPVPKEEVYRQAIRDVGEYEPLPIRDDAVETFQRRWATKGIGWFAEVVDDAKYPGYKKVFAYYGSSTYDVQTMSRLLDYLKMEMDNLGLLIPLSKEEEERVLKSWGKMP